MPTHLDCLECLGWPDALDSARIVTPTQDAEVDELLLQAGGRRGCCEDRVTEQGSDGIQNLKVQQ
jgi:hypothetical protein